jgi:type I restriction enzyme S subunit
MVWCVELDKDVPKGWKKGCLGDVITLQRGFDLPVQDRINGRYPIFASTGICQFHKDFKVKGPGIVTGRSGSLGEVFYIDENFWPLNTTLWVKEFKQASPALTYFILKSINISDYNSGSAVPTLNRNYIHMHRLVIPEKRSSEKFDQIVKAFFTYKKNIKKNLDSLNEL